MTAAALILAVSPASCGNADNGLRNSTPTPSEPLVLTESGGCGDAYFWAASEFGDVAVTVYVEARPRSADAPPTISFVLPDPAIQVEILTGHNLARNFCTDVIDTRSYPATTVKGVTGTGEIILDAELPLIEACGFTTGSLRLDGLISEDGTSFAPIDITAETIGCYSG